MEEPTAEFCGLALRGKLSGKIFVSSADRQDRLWATPSLVFNAYRRSLPEVKRPRREADRSRPSSTNIKNEWGYTLLLYMPSWFGQSQLFLFCLHPICCALIFCIMDRASSVGIATRYGLDGSRIQSRWGRDIPHPSSPALGPTQPPIQWVPGLSRE
jgi:hypothetical protein